MHIAFLNPQGNFDPTDRGWTEHPDFGGQLVYVKELALALGEMGCRVDIITRRVMDPEWPEFSAERDTYPGGKRVRILRFGCGLEQFLPKEELWPHIRQWKDRIAAFYDQDGQWPEGPAETGGVSQRDSEQRPRHERTGKGHYERGREKKGKVHAAFLNSARSIT